MYTDHVCKIYSDLLFVINLSNQDRIYLFFVAVNDLLEMCHFCVLLHIPTYVDIITTFVPNLMNFMLSISWIVVNK